MRTEHQEGVGTEIARLRVERGWSQRELAKVVGLDQSAVSRIEAGRRRVSAAELHRFAGVFHVTADTLLGAAAGGAVREAPWQASGAGAGRAPVDTWASAAPTGEQELLTAIARARSDPAAAEPRGEREATPPRDVAPAVQAPPAPAAAAPEPPSSPAATVPPAVSFAALSAPFRRPQSDDRMRSFSSVADALRFDAGVSETDASHGFAEEADAGEAPARESRRQMARRLRPAQDSVSAPPPGPSPSQPLTRAPMDGEDWAADVAGVIRDWFELRRLAAEPGPAHLWSTGQTADGRPTEASHPWQPVIPPPGSGDVLYDRVARFWRGELHVEPDDGPLPDLVPLLENGLGIQVVVARIRSLSQTFSDPAGLVSDPRPVVATVVSDGVPFVFVNAGRPVVLQRFALVHAFAHLVLGHGDVVDESIGWNRANPREAAANDFAEEFLAPARAVERWFARRVDLPRSPTVDTLLELANAFGISAWAALFRARAAGRLSPRQFAALRAEMRRDQWLLLPRQAFLGGLRDTLAHLTPAEVLPVGEFGPPAVLRVPACMRVWALALLRDGRLSFEDAAALLRLSTTELAGRLDDLGFE